MGRWYWPADRWEMGIFLIKFWLFSTKQTIDVVTWCQSQTRFRNCCGIILSFLRFPIIRSDSLDCSCCPLTTFGLKHLPWQTYTIINFWQTKIDNFGADRLLKLSVIQPCGLCRYKPFYLAVNLKFSCPPKPLSLFLSFESGCLIRRL